jgi:signal transduction histidine kinase
MIEQIYLAFILMGITIAAVVAALWYQARRASRINLGLIRLNEQHNFDTPVFLDHAWPLLEQAGLLGLSWRLDWFGIVKQGSHGRHVHTSSHKEIEVAEMKLTMTFYQHENRGEQRYFEETLIATFLLLLRTDMLIKANAIDATFANMSKLNLFLQHDMKNIAQFIQLMADQLSNVPPGKEAQVLAHLRRAAPLIRHRADRIVNTLTADSSPDVALREIHLHQVLTGLCALYELDMQIEGDALIHTAGTTIDTALDNILKNYHDASVREQSGTPQMLIVIENHVEHVSITIKAQNGASAPALERLFEPFWSSDAAGLGIGLYQAKQMLEVQGGSLQVKQDKNTPLRFVVTYPLRT